MAPKTTDGRILCADCPAWRPHQQWDWKTPILLQKTHAGEDGKDRPSIDDRGNPIWRKGPDGKPIKLGWCVLRAPVAQANGQAGWPQTMSVWDCEDSLKHELIAMRQ